MFLGTNYVNSRLTGSDTYTKFTVRNRLTGLYLYDPAKLPHNTEIGRVFTICPKKVLHKKLSVCAW